MPVTKNRFGCGHKGLGTHCHRCAQADRLEELAKNPPAQVANTETDTENTKKPKKKKSTSVDVEALLTEAKRLREEGKGRY